MSPVTVLVDADACPVKEEVYRVALRHGAAVVIVSNSPLRVLPHPLVRRVVVGAGFDAADDWIADATTAATVVVTADILLADRCLKAGATVLAPTGKSFTTASIGAAIATRAIMADLRAGGDQLGGPPPFAKTDRSRFLSALDEALVALQAVRRQWSAPVIPRELLGVAQVPGGAELRLFRRGDDFMIVLDRNELMNSRMSGSEEALASLVCERLAQRPRLHLLIGGYGMGFTLRAALARLGADAAITVAEILPAIVDWARGPMARLTGDCLDDPRVHLVYDDVAKLISDGGACYDAILLDVDNGPDGLTRAENDALYSSGGLAAAAAALSRGGILAIWSAAPDPAFTRRLSRSGFVVEEAPVKARSNGKGPTHMIWLATKR